MAKKAARRSKRDENGESAGSPAAAGPIGPGESADGASAAGSPPPPGRPGRPKADARLREVSLLVEEADYLLHLYRWIVLAGEPPSAQDWLKTEEWPHPDIVVEVFGSWEKFLAAGEVPDSPLLARARDADRQARDIEARERQLERELTRVDDLRRQAETAKRRREAAEAERDEEARRAQRLDAEVKRAEARAAKAEDRLAERRQEAEQSAVVSTGGEPSDEWLAAHEALLGELEAVRGHREDLLRQVEELREAADRDRQTVTRLSAALAEAGRAGENGGGDAAAPEAPPATVLEAVERAAGRLQHLTFTRSAFESAEDSPFRRPGDILETLERLDRLGGLYADPSGFGTSLTEAAASLGLSWRADVSELARSRHPDRYTAAHDGARLDLGPHVAIGSGSGAGFIARIYLHVADGSGAVPRGLYVGHVGRHLPDTTT
ncbi:MAG: hypothetical protein QOD44_1653 [Solirubrobacteraceae bacterium]|nr:hypothetical protein [Solirubrobacteraceae bacterium]